MSPLPTTLAPRVHGGRGRTSSTAILIVCALPGVLLLGRPANGAKIAAGH